MVSWSRGDHEILLVPREHLVVSWSFYYFHSRPPPFLLSRGLVVTTIFSLYQENISWSLGHFIIFIPDPPPSRGLVFSWSSGDNEILLAPIEHLVVSWSLYYFHF